VILHVIDARHRDLGGFEVGRILPAAQHRMVGPFVFLDHIGPAVFAPGQGLDVRPHPHIGLSTVTYLLEGGFLHRDSLGSVQPIRPGAVNWMTAGRGIVHSERSEAASRASGGPIHGLQAWVALPVEAEECDPAFTHHPADTLPAYQSGGLWARLIAGAAFGATAPVPVHSPLFYVHWQLDAGTKAGLPDHEERAIYVASGAVETDGITLHAGQMAVYAAGGTPVVHALQPSTVIALGGANIGPRFIYWNLVSSSRERIEQAKADWAAGRMALPPGDDQEFIPLPDEPRPPEPMS
jgi:redox-sensitive bicupin YhaK (pirin superfamily)